MQIVIDQSRRVLKIQPFGKDVSRDLAREFPFYCVQRVASLSYRYNKGQSPELRLLDRACSCCRPRRLLLYRRR